MTKRFTLLPVAMVLIIGLLALIAIVSGRSNDTGLVGDRTYPFHICTINDYCEGGECSREPVSFLVYLEHADGKPRLEMPRVNPTATLEPIRGGLEFETRGGEVSGILNIFSDRALEFIGTSGDASDPVEHFATGSCERLKTP